MKRDEIVNVENNFSFANLLEGGHQKLESSKADNRG